MKLAEILNKINVIDIKGNNDIDITGINIDSRKIANGHLFVAICGTQVDGHQFISKAIELGATAILCEKLPETCPENVTFILVKSTENCVGQAATNFYGDPTSKLKLVGVTGTNGTAVTSQASAGMAKDTMVGDENLAPAGAPER